MAETTIYNNVNPTPLYDDHLIRVTLSSICIKDLLQAKSFQNNRLRQL